MSDSPQRVNALHGRVEAGPAARGTKSQRNAVFLQTATQRLVLRRKGAPAFGDTELQALVGQDVECDGFVIGTTFLAETIVPTLR